MVRLHPNANGHAVIAANLTAALFSNGQNNLEYDVGYVNVPAFFQSPATFPAGITSGLTLQGGLTLQAGYPLNIVQGGNGNYNEGIRIGIAPDGYSNIVPGTDGTGSGSAGVGQWSISRIRRKT